ncbi:short chain dehydrogenase [Pycnococcus provasolii]
MMNEEFNNNKRNNNHGGGTAAGFVARYVAPCWPVGHVLGLKGISGYGSSSTASEVLIDQYPLWAAGGGGDEDAAMTTPPSSSAGLAVVTGANSGLGREVARVLASEPANMHVVMACRSTEKANAVADEMRADDPNAKLYVMQLDLDNLESVRGFARKLKARTDTGEMPPLRLLVLNAGIMPPKEIQMKEMENGEQIEQALAVNFAGHHLLAEMLEEQLKTGARVHGDARVVVVSSAVHRLHGVKNCNVAEFGASCSPLHAYARSKLAGILHVRQLASRWRSSHPNLRAVAVHPGGVDSQGSRDSATGSGATGVVLRALGAPFVKSVAQGAASIVWACTSPLATSGSYVANCNVAMPAATALDANLALALEERARSWTTSTNALPVDL